MDSFNLYCNLMDEVKRRVEVILSVIHNDVPVPKIVGVELCYLQLRMICELIALACLSAHGDIPAAKAKRLTKSYNADQIIKHLSLLHPDFYPLPGRQVKKEGKVISVEAVTEPHLQKEELLRLYGECGDFLHKGNIENLMKGHKAPDLKRIHEWVDKIRTLLSHHQIQLSDPDKQLWVIMKSKDDGRVRAFEMHRESGPRAP